MIADAVFVAAMVMICLGDALERLARSAQHGRWIRTAFYVLCSIIVLVNGGWLVVLLWRLPS